MTWRHPPGALTGSGPNTRRRSAGRSWRVDLGCVRRLVRAVFPGLVTRVHRAACHEHRAVWEKRRGTLPEVGEHLVAGRAPGARGGSVHVALIGISGNQDTAVLE